MNGKVKHGKADRAAHKTRVWRRRDGNRVRSTVKAFEKFAQATYDMFDTVMALQAAFAVKRQVK